MAHQFSGEQLAVSDTKGSKTSADWVERVQPITQAESEGISAQAEATFKPTSKAVERFENEQYIGYGLTKEQVDRITQKIKDPEQKQFGEFLSKHFDDVCKLSTTGDAKHVTHDDLKLYAEMLKQNEKKPNSTSAIEEAHYEHEMNKASLLPTVGKLGGLYAGHKAFGVAMYTPPVARGVIDIALMNPSRAAATTALVCASAYVGSFMAGNSAGHAIYRGMHNGEVRKHFVDEAAPAMKRLLG
ncbi:MAG TPA: hypothetical protein EYN91_08500 [Candidatus Melainabacteria bacterium]|nr:hypothetical protein [Candidatus Melainabacteria bacterium]HIN66217.1 hypothetical protein [Candidatus Obscuribacterales bacterium]